jgi:hypothetical protein
MSRQAFTTCSPLAVNCVLYQELSLTNLWGAGVYYDGADCWEVNSSGVITGTTTCVALATISINTNDSTDVSMNIGSILVNGVTVINVTGVDPNTPGNGGEVQSTQIGTYTVEIPYSATTSGQSITLLDSNSASQCYATGTGSGTAIFYSVAIDSSVTLNLTANAGACT